MSVAAVNAAIDLDQEIGRRRVRGPRFRFALGGPLCVRSAISRISRVTLSSTGRVYARFTSSRSSSRCAGCCFREGPR